MASIFSLFHSYCKIQLKPLGFIKHGNLWCRIVGDVYQGIYIEKSAMKSKTCNVDFGIVPLCSLIEYPDGVGQYRLDELWPLDSFNLDPVKKVISYNPKVVDAEAVMSKIKKGIEEYVLPMFEEGVDCATAFNALIRLQYLIEERRKAVLDYLRLEDRSEITPDEGIMINEQIFFMALKKGDYDFVMRCLNMMKKLNVKYRIDWIDELPLWIAKNDTVSIHNVLRIREEASLKTLSFLRQGTRQGTVRNH